MPSSLRLRNAVTSSFIGGGNFQHMKYFDGTIYEPQGQRGVEVEINYVQTATAQGPRGCGSPIKPAPSIKDENNTGQRCFSTRRERAVQKRNPSLLSINDGLQQFSQEPSSAYSEKVYSCAMLDTLKPRRCSEH